MTSTALNLLLTALLGSSLLVFAGALIQLVLRELGDEGEAERIYRGLALVGGAVIALGAQASNLSFASFIVESLAGSRPAGSAFTTAAVLIPGGLSAALGWYFARVMKRSGARALRFMTGLGMLTVVSFLTIYAQATATKGVFLGATAIPNATFVAGLILAVLVFAPTKAEEQASGTKRSGDGRISRFFDQVREQPRTQRGFVRDRASDSRTSDDSRGHPFDDD